MKKLLIIICLIASSVITFACIIQTAFLFVIGLAAIVVFSIINLLVRARKKLKQKKNDIEEGVIDGDFREVYEYSSIN